MLRTVICTQFRGAFDEHGLSIQEIPGAGEFVMFVLQ